MDKLYDGDTFERNGLTFRVTFRQDDIDEYPWDWSDGHGPVRKSKHSHQDGVSDKRPCERPLNSADRNEYQFYYDWQAALKTAKKDGWNALPYDAPNKSLRAVQADFDYLRGYVNGEWCYLCVRVECLETGEQDSLGMVQSMGDYASECAYELADDLAHQHQVDNRFADAMACGV